MADFSGTGVVSVYFVETEKVNQNTASYLPLATKQTDRAWQNILRTEEHC